MKPNHTRTLQYLYETFIDLFRFAYKSFPSVLDIFRVLGTSIISHTTEYKLILDSQIKIL